MDAKREIREFLTSRRARVTPEQAGLRTFGGLRRVPGLRREEVALLAGVSVDYYTRLERGNAAGVSDTVLDALARALQLDDVERAHLVRLARAAHGSGPRRRRARQRIRPTVQHLLDAMTGTPAFVRNDRLDILAANRLGRAFYSQHFDSPYQPVNSARFAFLDPRAVSFYVDWEGVAKDLVGVLHEAAGRDPYDRELSDLVGELSTRSETFRTLWAAHNVRRHDTGVKAVHHPLVGKVTFTYESMELVADPGLTLFVYTTEPARVRAGAEPACELDGDARRGDRRCRSRGTASRPQPDRVTGSPARSTSTALQLRRTARRSGSPKASASASDAATDRSHPPRRPRLLRARRGALARRSGPRNDARRGIGLRIHGRIGR